VCSLGRTLLAFAPFACYSGCFLTSYFCISVPYNEKDIFLKGLVGLHRTVENSERDGNTRPPDLPLEKSGIQVRKQQLERDMEQQTGSK